MKDKETGETNDEIEINEIRLDDSNNNNYKFTKIIHNETKKQKKKKHFYIPFLPRMYWLFYRRPITFLIFISPLAEGWTNMATTICMGNIIDAIHKENGLQIVKMNAIYALIASIICAIFAYFNYSMWIIIGDLIGVKIRRLLFKSYMKKDIEFFDKHSIGKLLILLQQDCSSVFKFKHVWFKYPTRDSWILKDVSFETEPSKATAIVGHSGSGKSTIVQLLLRFYDVDQGEILLDRINIKEYRLNPTLFTLSIRDNIAYSKPNAIDEEILNAAKVANAANFISKLPNKFNTLCGEKGTFLSGGQIQRIAIARVVIENPTLLITDEATSALDAESESLVQAALEKVMNGRTSIIIAHRMGTIRVATKIFVFDQGSIVENGTHEQLIEMKGAYYKLLQKQLTK